MTKSLELCTTFSYAQPSCTRVRLNWCDRTGEGRKGQKKKNGVDAVRDLVRTKRDMVDIPGMGCVLLKETTSFVRIILELTRSLESGVLSLQLML